MINDTATCLGKISNVDKLFLRAIPFNQYKPTKIIVAPSAIYLNTPNQNAGVSYATGVVSTPLAVFLPTENSN